MPEGAGRGHRVRLSGGTILNIYDELYRHPEIHHILTSHEQGAAHAADGYARATGKTGVCMATSGPGATNLVTGIATAYMDSTPMVAITCNVGKALLGKDSFQEIDIAGVAMPITKYSVIVKDITVLADTLRAVRFRLQRAEDRARFWWISRKMSRRQRMNMSQRHRKQSHRLSKKSQKKDWITLYL